VRVALPVPVDRLFDYALDARALGGGALGGGALETGPGRMPGAPLDREVALVGRRVRVAFGGQKLVGLIVPDDLRGTDESAAPRALSAIEELIDEEPAVSEELIRVLAEEAAAIYCPIGLAIAHGLPPGSAPRVARPWALTTRGERALAQGALGGGALGGEARPLLARLAEGAATLPVLVRALPGIAVARRLESLARDGLVERRLERRAARARVPTVRIARVVAGLDLEQAATTTLAPGLPPRPSCCAASRATPPASRPPPSRGSSRAARPGSRRACAPSSAAGSSRSRRARSSPRRRRSSTAANASS
jgi:hypothetical protein